ncbi:MAG: hypothetical protein WAN16_01035 [Chthoniobacterales bacterium]
MRDLEEEICLCKHAARVAKNLPEKLELEKKRRSLETKRDEAWKEDESAASEIEKKKDSLIDEVEKKLRQNLNQ